jgi:hypothetical protein
MSSNLNRRRIALMVSCSPTLGDFINKKLGANKNNNQRPILIKKNIQNENTTNKLGSEQ